MSMFLTNIGFTIETDLAVRAELMLSETKGAARLRLYRWRRKLLGEEDTTRRNRKQIKAKQRDKGRQRNRPFTACDGEGAGRDRLGRQKYMLFRMGERELYTGRRLKTVEILDFICKHPDDECLVGFSFGYDVTMILLDLSDTQRKRLLEPIVRGPGRSPYTWFGDYDVEYMPGNYFRVRRVEIQTYIDPDTKLMREHREPVEGSVRTIWETHGFFRKGFVDVLADFDVGTEDERHQVAVGKASRGTAPIDAAARAYCALECRLLAEVMERFRADCLATDIKPKTWSGAGKLAEALHEANGTIRREAVEALPAGLLRMAERAYYGGRFEVSRVGFVDRPVWQYDIRSAYPAAMLQLPCLEHGRWVRLPAPQLRRLEPGSLYLAEATFTRAEGGEDVMGRFMGLPSRAKAGHICWPARGRGTYWSVEIESAEAIGHAVRLRGDGWAYERRCDCVPFGWVAPLYERRQALGADTAGQPLKTAIAALYGKLVQRKGSARFLNPVWGGLVTAITRARINGVLAEAGADAFMVATDAVYSLRPLDLETGPGLGQWECKEASGAFVVQPGVHWNPHRRSAVRHQLKTRGMSPKFFEEKGVTERFEAAWREFAKRDMATGLGAWPRAEVGFRAFTGMKLATAQGKPEAAGCWTDETKVMSFNPVTKREIRGYRWEVGEHGGAHVITEPRWGDPRTESVSYRQLVDDGVVDLWDIEQLLQGDEQPDPIELSTPFKERTTSHSRNRARAKTRPSSQVNA